MLSISFILVNCIIEDIDNAELLVKSDGKLNSVVAYSCKEGFARVSGDAVLTCTEKSGDGIWTGVPLKCKKHISTG